MQKFIFLFCAVIQLTGASWTTRAVGTVKCYGSPMPDVTVTLKDKDLYFDDVMGTSRTDHNGYFDFTGSGSDLFNGKPEPYLRVEFQSQGHTVVQTTTHRRHDHHIDFGIIRFTTPLCLSYLKCHDSATHSVNC